MATYTEEYVLVDGLGGEQARGTPAQIGDAILSYDGRGWGAEELEADPTWWNAYCYVGSKIEHMSWLSVTATNEGEAIEKLKIAAFHAGGIGHGYDLSVDRASDFDAIQAADAEEPR